VCVQKQNQKIKINSKRNGRSRKTILFTKKKKHLEAEPRLTMDYRCCGRVVAETLLLVMCVWERVIDRRFDLFWLPCVRRTVALLGLGDLAHDRVDVLAAAFPRPLATVEALDLEAHADMGGLGDGVVLSGEEANFVLYWCAGTFRADFAGTAANFGLVFSPFGKRSKVEFKVLVWAVHTVR
jgi:hypothetical protein